MEATTGEDDESTAAARATPMMAPCSRSRWSTSAATLVSRSPSCEGASNSAWTRCPLAVDGGFGQPLEVGEVAEHRAGGHPGPRRDVGDAGADHAVVVERQQGVDHRGAAALGASVAPVDVLGVPGVAIRLASASPSSLTLIPTNASY